MKIWSGWWSAEWGAGIWVLNPYHNSSCPYILSCSSTLKMKAQRLQYNYEKLRHVSSLRVRTTALGETWTNILMLAKTKVFPDFFLNNQPDPLIIPNLFCHKTLHVSGNFCAHHQECSTVHSALVIFMHVMWPLPSRVRMELQFHPDSAWKRSSETCMKRTNAECTVEILMMGRENAQNM